MIFFCFLNQNDRTEFPECEYIYKNIISYIILLQILDVYTLWGWYRKSCLR